MIDINSFFLGPMDNIVYVLSDTETRQCCVIDPAWDVPQLIQTIQKNQLTLTYILLTHGHHDHVNGLSELLAYSSVPVYLSCLEANHLIPTCPDGDSDLQLHLIGNGHDIKLGKISITAYTTPGHTPGGLCYQIGTHLFSGDTVFVDGCGRCDLQSSDVDQMYDSLQWIKSLPDDTIIYPGHHYGATETDTIGGANGTFTPLFNIV